MSGLIDLHCHILPGVDDGPETIEASVDLVNGLRRLGFKRIIATPHVRPPRWEQDMSHLITVRDRLVEAVGEGCPTIDIAAENFFDDTAWTRYQREELICYPGGKAVLVELSGGDDDVPLNLDKKLFEMSVKGLKPVLAHPERQDALSTDLRAYEKLVHSGTLPVISVSSLAGFFGSLLRRRAEALIKLNLPLAVATDAHSAEELKVIERGLKRLNKLVGEGGITEMLISTPMSVLGDE